MTELDAWVLLRLTLTKATPLLLAAVGGLASERTGVINIALEGMMLAGAFGAAAGGIVLGSAAAGVMCGVLMGCLFAGLHALVCLRFRADQIVSGTAVNLLALGITGYLLYELFGVHGSSPSAPRLSVPDWLPGRGPLSIFRQPVTVAAALASPFAAWYVLFRTPLGLRIRATGESPETARAAGIHTMRIRTWGVLTSGALAGLAGVHLAMGDLSQFVERMTSGRGFIALAALIVGKWHPLGALVACLLFGFAEALSDSLQSVLQTIPSQVFLALPFVLTMLVLAGFVGRSRPPRGLGRLET